MKKKRKEKSFVLNFYLRTESDQPRGRTDGTRRRQAAARPSELWMDEEEEARESCC